MKSAFLPDAERYQRAHRRRRIWYRVVTGLAAVVVFCTTYALILPAITLESTYICEQAEHLHGEDCWGTTLVEQVTTSLTCAPECHSHSPECYDDSGQLICGLADRLLHSHDASCCDDSGQLICTLPEVVEHLHDESCYQETRELICGQEETYHVHGEDCYAVQRGEMTCTLDEGEEHQHTDECYDWEQLLTCEIPEDPEGHRHSEDCYQLTCMLVCPLEQIAVHEHGPDCYDGTGALVCGILSAQTHQHTADCWVSYTDTTEERVLLCDLSEHSHTEACLPQKQEPEEPETPTEEPGLTAAPTETPTDTPTDAPADAPADLPAETPGDTPDQPELPDTPKLPELPEDGETLPAQDILCGLAEHAHSELCYDALGNLACGMDAHVHTPLCLTAPLPTPEEQEAALAALQTEVDALAAAEQWTEEQRTAAEALLARLDEAHGQSQLSDAGYMALYEQLQALLAQSAQVTDPVAEVAEGTNWMLLRDSGWFEAYSAYGDPYSASTYSSAYAAAPLAAAPGDTSPSSVQVDDPGGEKSADDVTVSKTIAGTDIENVFDITLTVETPQKLNEVITEPDMAVVIVMDISNTMNDNFGGVTRYAAAMEAADDFLDKFAASNSLGISKVGYVAFNTDAHQIFGLQPCTNETQANELKNIMRQSTGPIINASDYGSTHNRFTNIEGGLKMARDMLAGASNKNKFIILLTDGFPTTYLSEGSSGYSGYDPYDTTGRFYDHVLNKPCRYGTSYSDEAAIRARVMAGSIRDSGTTIFSIGVDVGGQTIQAYIEKSEKATDHSIVDRTGTTYEIGDATSTDAYKSWLRDSIGSGYYYDSTNTDGLKTAYDQIFEKIKETVTTATAADWVASDPIPSTAPDEIEFIGLYDKTPTLQGESLTGTNVLNGENTANYDGNSATISWDLKRSGYTKRAEDSTTWYQYTLTYRVRLKNEDAVFEENKVYQTNGRTELQYRVVTTANGVTSISDAKTIEFPVPSVHGYLGELTFYKKDSRGSPLAGAEFTLHHADSCHVCRGDGKSQVTIADQVATSGEDGAVSFINIPSGHIYTLTETKIPPGYTTNGNHYTVTVAYDIVTVTVTAYDQKTEVLWDGAIVNNAYYELPQTGGWGVLPCYIAGAALIAAAGLLYRSNKRRRGAGCPH